MIAQRKQVLVATKRGIAKIGTNRNSKIAFLTAQPHTKCVIGASKSKLARINWSKIVYQIVFLVYMVFAMQIDIPSKTPWPLPPVRILQL